MILTGVRFKKRLIYWVVSLLFVFSGLFVRAQLTDDAYVVKTVSIFASAISSEGWSNVETISFQNLDNDALLQNFNSINSATLDSSARPVNTKQNNPERTEESDDIVDEVEDIATSTTETVSSSTDETNNTEEEVQEPVDNEEAIEFTEPEEVPVESISIEEEVEVQTTTTETEIPEEATPEIIEAIEQATTTVLRRAQGLFALAIGSLASGTEEAVDEPEEDAEDLMEEAEDDVVVESPEEQELVAEDSVTDDTGNQADDASPEIEQDLTEEFVATTTNTTDVEEPSESDNSDSQTVVDSEVSEPETAEESPVVETESPAPENDGIKPHIIRLTDFGYPLEEGVEVAGAQLRMSFAAQKKPTREDIPVFTVQYSLNGGESWTIGGSLVIDEEVSNSINGGYYLFALPDIDDAATLDNLQVELVYRDDPALVKELFVDSVWLELFVLETSEANNEMTALDEILAADGYQEGMLQGDTLTLPEGEEINFTFTDDNTDETLIIKTDSVTYNGLSEATTYFSITNSSNKVEEITVKTYFPDDVGEVTNLEVFNQNKPRDVVIPEYRPYVYHCEGGWEVHTKETPDSLQELSQQLLSSSTVTNEPEPKPVSPVEFAVPTSTEPASVLPVPATNTTTTVLRQLSSVAHLVQFSTTTAREAVATSSEEFTDEQVTDEANEEEVVEYMCRNTNVVRTCDTLDGNNTACRMNGVKVADHEVVRYTPGWDGIDVEEGVPEVEPGFITRLARFIGFGPTRKEIPDKFEVRSQTEEAQTIEPGETKYFRMDIAFPPFSSGEYWIEAIGNSEYGLLDPFWSSQWTYRMPITIDNTLGTETLNEHQIFLELDSSLTDFWTNVSSDGSDIRFVQETVVGNEEAWYGTGWNSRTPITIQASQIDSDLTDFPVYVDLSDLGASFFSAVQADGSDIRITESDGLTELPYELVAINTGVNTGELHFKASSISSSVDTTFYIYHDNPNVSGYINTDTYGADNVWNSDYIAVYHLEEDAAGRGTAGLYQDSTVNEYDADDELNSTGKSGLLGRGQEVNAQGDAAEYILLPSDVVNGENQLTFSYWFNSSETNNQALINGGANNEYLIFMQSGGTVMNLFPGASPTVNDVSISPQWRHVMVSRDSTANQWRIFIDGVEDNDSPSANALSALSIPENCLVIGLEQDTSCLNSGDTTQHTNGLIDEMRFYNVVPTDAEISATYRNQATTTDFYTVGSIDNLQITSFSELDFWLQHFSTTTDEADVWVQVDSLAAGASTTIHLYYGSVGATSASDEFAPFTYDTLTDTYYVVHGDVTQDITLYSLIDNNQVQVDGGTVIDLDKGEATTISGYASTSVVSVLGPITARQNDNEGEPVVPISFATTTFVSPSSRNTEEFHLYSPFGSTTVEIYDATTLEATQSIATNTAALVTNDIASAGVVESTLPVLFYQEGGNNDSFVGYPPTLRDIYGYDSNSWYISTAEASVTYDIFCTTGTGATGEVTTRGSQDGNTGCNASADAGGDAVRITNQTGYVGAIQQADSDGGDSTTFLPELEFGTEYYIPVNVDYVAAICSPRFGTSTIEIYNGGGTTATEIFTCTPGADTPGTVRFTQGSSGDDQQYTAGTRVVSSNDVPFYVIYDHTTDDDETNTWSAVQARKYDPVMAGDRSTSFGSQEVNIDAEYEQLSFAWYQNVNGETPTTTWSLGDDGDVVEGQPITGQGSVNDGDVLRLRMNLQANTATATASSTAFALQYAVAETCNTATEWFEIGKVGSTTAAFSGYNNTAIDDAQTLTSTLLASSTVFGTYEEASLSARIKNEIPLGEVAEWDWVITSSNAQVNTEYCFRMVRSSGNELTTYTLYPQLVTSGPPESATLLKRFDNEHANSLRPTFEFFASDLSGDDLTYEIQIDDDADFSSTIFDQDSNVNFLRFENITVPSDKAPFTSGQVIRYTPPSDLTSSTTYWWRVRSIDEAGSNTYSDWSESFSFTINESLTVSEWIQTTDEQFETNSLISATTSGSGSVELDLGGSNVIGEYGVLDVTNGATSSVVLNNVYSNPVVTASIEYSKTVPNGDQPSARVFNKTGTGFDVLADNFTNNAPGTSTIHYVVMEAGEYLMDDGGDGLRVFATSTSVSGYIGSPITGDPGLDIVFPTSFSGAPSVLTMVTTNNDPDWILSTVYDGNSVGNPPTASQLGVYIQDNIASDGHSSAEDVDIIAFDQGIGTNNGVAFDIFNTGIDSGGAFVDDTADTFTFSQTFSSVPAVTAVQQLTMNGNQGGYAMVDIDTPTTITGLDIAVEEGGTTGARTHADEDVAVVVFENSSGNIIRAGSAQVTSTEIDFDDAEIGNAWGEFSFNDVGDVTYHIEYQTGSGFADVPDSVLAGNSTGFTTSPVNILNLDTDIYNEIRIVADLSGVNPEIFDWTVTWGQRVDIPSLGDPFDNQQVPTTTPTFDFVTTDPQGDSLVYEISWSTDNTFTSASTTYRSDSSSDFSPGSPYTSGDTVMFTIAPGDALTDGETYWWRVRAKDPGGGDSFSPWSDPDSFTVDITTSISTWFQTTQEQFIEGELDGVTASTSDSIEITTEVGEYGTTSVTNNSWTLVTTNLTYNNMVVVASPEYAFNGTDNGRTVQVRNKTNNSFEIKADNYTESLSGVTDIDYVVMEAGDWLISDGAAGARVIAGTVSNVSQVEGSSPGYVGGALVDFDPDFLSVPGALTTVSTANGSEWVATVIDDGTQTGEITAAEMYVALGVGLDTNTVRTPEDIDYLAFEATTGTNNSVLFDMFNTPNVVTESETESTISFNQTFGSAPGLIVVQNNGTNGGDGGFAQVDTDTAITATEVDITIAEMGANAGNHAAEVVSVLVFESEAGTIRRESTTSGGLTGTVASEPILFTDGTGPKFAQAIIASTSPGNSSTSIQVQYEVSDGVWALIPDAQIPGNSTGNVASSIDLTNVDVSSYQVIRLLATLQCDSSNCPTLDDWTIEWSEGVPISGTIAEYDRATPVTSGTVRVAVNGTPGNTGSIAGDGTWTINNVTAFDGDTVTVWVDGAAEANEAVAVFVYDGIGDMINIELFEQHLSLSAAENGTTTNVNLAAYDNSVSGDEDIFFDVDSFNDLEVCAISGCSNANLYIGPGDIYIPDTTDSGNVLTHDFINDGTFDLDGNTMRVSGSWDDNSNTTLVDSTVIFTATSTTETIADTDGVLNFGNITFGETAGTAVWQAEDPYDIDGDLLVDFGTFDRASSSVTVAGNITTNTNGFWNGIATTTFDGTGSSVWSDTNSASQSIGYAVVDGDSKTVFLGSDVAAENMVIGANDTLNGGGTYTLSLAGNFINNGTFLPQTSTVAIIGSSTNAAITLGGSTLYNLTASSTGGSVSFTESNATLLGDLTIATGTVTLATDTTTIDGSFINTGGAFAHNNAEVRFTSTDSETIQLLGTDFLNHFYDVSFAGSGDWQFLDTNATTTNTVTITNGDVVLPSGQLSVGRDFTTSGSGAFSHNNGEVLFLIKADDVVTTNGSSFNNVRFREGDPIRDGDFDPSWLYRDMITINASEIDDDLINFPVYLDLSDLGTNFFSNINSDGGDIRITVSDGVTEVPREVVSASTTLETGEVHFLAPTLSSTTDTIFYIYYGNSAASDYAITDTYGAENVWTNSFLAVLHMEELNALDSTAYDKDTTATGDTPAVATGLFGNAISLTDNGGSDYLDFGDDLDELEGLSNMTVSAWVNVTDDGNDDSFFTRELTGNTDPILLWDNIGGSTNNDTYTFNVSNTGSAANRVDAAPTGVSVGDTWQFVSATMNGGNREIFVDGSSANTNTGGDTTIAPNNSGAAIGFWSVTANFDYDGLIDEWRLSTTTRSDAWIAAEYRNMATSTDFYTVASGVASSTRILSGVNVDALGDVVIENGQVQFPSGQFTIGGSFDNDGTFVAGSGEVVFNSTTSSETVAAGNSLFYDLTFDDAGGVWTVTENATATNQITLANASSFIVDFDVTLESTGLFSNEMDNAATNWGGATLRLSSGSDFAINSKDHLGDDYNIITTVGDTDISMWNSTAATYDTQDTSSIYSQDHDSIDGDLYIFGDYVREVGTEYWSYTTDFDGMDLVASGTERQVNVRIENGASVTASSTTFSILGDSSASTTVNAQSGSFSLIAQSAVVNAQYFTMTGTDANGLQLLSSSTVNLLDNAEFIIPAASAAVTVDATTIDTNPAAQFFNTDFNTGGGSVNVTLSGSPASFWWFRDGAGDRYGEAFDNADGDPGSIRWDDSNYQITISGSVYADDGVTPIGGPTCDGVTANVRVVVDGGAYTDAVSCDGITGAYTLNNVSYGGDANLVVYLDTNGGAHGTVVSRTPTGDITDLNIYANQVIVRHEDEAVLSIADMTEYDNDDDSDIYFTASTSTSPDSLDVVAGSGLYVWNNKEFVPSGTVTLLGGGNYIQDGTLTIGLNATYTSELANDITVGGSFFVNSGATFAGASSTVAFTATNTAQQISAAASSTINFYDIEFNGVGGGWVVQTPIVVETNILVSTGTVSGVSDIEVQTGSFSGNGLVSMTGGTVEIQQTNTLGGTQGWTFNNLTLGDGATAGITTPASMATTTILSVLDIAGAHFLDAGGSAWDLQGNGTVFTETGTFIEATSTVRYSGTSADINRTLYYNLVIDAESGGGVTAVAPVLGLQVANNLIVGQLGTSTLDVATNNPTLSVLGDVYVGALGAIQASAISDMTVNGSWDNDGTFTSNGGVVNFSRSAGSATIAAGDSSFAQLNINGTANYTMTENATATQDMNISSNAFTLNPGLTLAVGGSFSNTLDDVDTTWTGTTLYFYSGTAFEINAPTTGDTYGAIVTADGTHPRMWNSTSTAVTTNGVSSVYSMDHANNDGDLYIFGDYVNSSYADHWSYATDFDGTPLGTSRTANVLIEAGGSASYDSGSLTVLGSTSASTTIDVQSSGTYQLTLGGDTSVTMDTYVIRNTTIDGLIFSGTPSISDISYGDFEVSIDGGSVMTVGGTVITANPAKNFTNIRMATTTAINAFNVTATGTSASAWRFVNVIGNLDGEELDVDPGGDPGYVTWEDSAAIINITGTVYSDEGVTVSGVCDSLTNNIRLSVNGLTFSSTTCNIITGDYSFNGISYGLGDTLTVYIDGEAEKAVTVTKDPVSSIANFDLYENRIVIRHESTDPMTIADLEVWDSDDDPDLLFDAEIGSPDTLLVAADTKILIADGKEFAPGGNVTVPGGGSGSAYDGTIELQDNASFTAANGESHTIGGSLLSGTNAVFTPAESSFIFTTTGSGRTIDSNESGFYDVTFNGSGSWTSTDTELSILNDITINNGTLTLPSATTTVAGSFTNTGGSFDANAGLLYFTATSSGKVVQFNSSDAAAVIFDGAGGAWTMTDVNATTTDSFIVEAGSVALPTGALAINGDFVVEDTITHSSGSVVLTSTSGGNVLTLASNDLNNLSIAAGGGDYVMTDASASLLGDLFITTGTFTAGTGTLSIGGSFDASASTFVASTGTVLFNSNDTGEFIDSGVNEFYNVVIAGAGGGWTMLSNATTTNNFTLSLGNAYVQNTGTTLYVGGVFTNNVGGSATTWTGSTLILDGGIEYEINSKSTPTEFYETLVIGENTDISGWNSAATTTNVAVTSSLYSQDHAGVDGDLNIYGDYHIATTTEYWSYATDFDGTALGGSPRAVSVSIASSSVITLEGGGLEIIGIAGATSSITNQGSGFYTVNVTGGTLNADYYSWRNLTITGLLLSNTPTIVSLDNGDFEQAENNSELITLSSTTLNANASLLISNTRFATGGFTGGRNVSLDATTTNSWTFTGAIGDLWGEAFDIDGSDQCSSIRWDDSSCLLTEQAHYRWRNDDGGEGAAPGTWFDGDWSTRKRVRVVNDDSQSYTNTAVKLAVDYEASMQADFDDLRFTDSSGTVLIDHWLERNNVTDAEVWVEIPTLATSSVTELYMYYGNVSATSTSNPNNVFTAVDTFDDNNISEYSGDTSLFATGGTHAFGAGFGLDASPNTSAKATDGIARTDITVSQGEIIRYMQYVDTTAGSGDEVCTMFAVQSPVTNNNNYAVCLEQFGIDRVSIVEDVENTDSTGTVLASSTITFATGWYEVEIDWQTGGTMDVSVYDSSGTLQATTSATDSTYTSGGIGFTFWFQNGGWDNYVSWPRTDTKPTAYFGAEQADGGASWSAAQNVAGSGYLIGETARLRIGVENTGLDIVDQNFQLEYAPKLSAPNCEAVAPGGYTAVPVAASCGASPICMTSSAGPTNGDSTTDHLVTSVGQFVAGEFVADTSNQTTNLNVNQNQYTELEYALELTVNAVNDAYCFRVTDSGSTLDSYAKVPELTLAFDPTMDAVTLNDGIDIALTPGTTTLIIASTTVTDLNGFADLSLATTTFYKTSVGASCTSDDNNCYIATSSCSFTNCVGNECTLQCAANIEFHADATDQDGAEEWFAFMEVSDASGGYVFGTSLGVELLTLRALDVQNSISYGSVGINENTGSFNPDTQVINIGNQALDVQISGTDMTDGLASIIPVSEQRYSTSTFTYDSCTSCTTLTLLGDDMEVDLPKPTTAAPAVSDTIYWGIEVPFGTASNPHSGINYFTAISD